METERQKARRAIEALRSGVPNRDAVSTLECNQSTIENLFRRNLGEIRDSYSNGSDSKGIIVKGGFGTGKSHLLEYLQHIALKENFICSKIVISKETPLYDPVKLFRAAADTAIIQGKRGSAIAEVAESIDISGGRYADLREWTHSTNDISPIFAATVFLLSRLNQDPERRDRIFRFWAGEKLSVAEVRRYLKDCGEAASYKINQVNLKDLALQRFKFVPRLIQAAGYSGWVFLIDEVELVGCYSMRQRAKSYAELARWRGELKDSYTGLTTVFAITEDFEEKILFGKGDLENIPGKLRALALSDMWVQIADHAEKGMRAIQQSSIQLKEPTEELRKQIFNQIRDIYAKAYNWPPPITSTFSRLTSTRMREYIRAWITNWDLKRLYPKYESNIEINEVGSNYFEDDELQPEEETT